MLTLPHMQDLFTHVLTSRLLPPPLNPLSCSFLRKKDSKKKGTGGPLGKASSDPEAMAAVASVLEESLKMRGKVWREVRGIAQNAWQGM